MADAFLLFFSFAVCAVATFSDLKKRIIPDWLTYSAIAVGGILSVAKATALGMDFILAYSAMLAVGIALGYALFRLGVWAGGDTKLFWAMAVLFGATGKPDVLLPVAVFALSVLIFLPLGFALNANAVFSKRLECIAIAAGNLERSLCAASAAAIVAVAAGNYVAWIAAAAVFSLIRLPTVVWAVIALIAAVLNLQAAAYAFAISFVLVFCAKTAIEISKKIITPTLIAKVRLSGLKEGMLPAQSVLLVKGKVVLFSPKLDIGSIVAAAGKEKDVKKILQQAGLTAPKGARIIADSTLAGGLDALQLGRLKKLGKVRWLAIRRTEAFAPALCAAFLIVQMMVA